MNTHKSPRRLVSALILVCLLVAAPAALESQCPVASTYMFPTTPTVVVFKVLSGAYVCGTTMTNAVNCSPSAPVLTTFLLATANTAVTTNPSCAWSCVGCPGSAPHVEIDGDDGLPVELMEFGFEDEPAEGVGGGGESAGGR